MQQQHGPPAVPRLPTVVASSAAGLLPFCTPSQPSNVTAGAPPSSAQLVPTAGLLHAVCGALLSADISQLQTRVQGQALAPQPGTLEHALLELNPLVFRNHAGTHHSATPPSVPQQQQQQEQQQRSASRSRTTAQPASTTSGASPDEGAAIQHAAKRRKTTAPAVQEEYVARTVDVQQVAATVAEDISSFMQQMAAFSAALGEAAQQPADSIDQDNAGKRSRKSAGRGSKASQAPVPVAMLKQLQTSLAAGKQAGILHQLDQEQLRQLLLLLLDHVRLGQDQLLDEQETATSDSAQAVSIALEAACCCMQVLSAASMHNSLYIDEVVTAAVSLAKYHLQYNVLALHDQQFKRLYRPSAAQDAPLPNTGKRKTRDSLGAKPAKFLADVRGKLELLLSLLAQVVERIVLEVELLLPLVRVALSCLAVDDLQLLQAQAVGLTVSVFRAFPQQRTTLADEVLNTAVGGIHVSGKAPPRLCEATGPSLQPLPIMMVAALLVQLVQVSVELQDMDADPTSVQRGFIAAYGWSDYLWKGILAKLPAAKAAKTDGSGDFKLVMQALVADLLTMQMLPEWPAANILLRRFIKQLYGEAGLKHKDAAVKLACVEFTGQLATALCAEALTADREADEVQAVKEAAQDQAALQAADGQQPAASESDLLLLDYLAASPSGSSASSSSSVLASARRFVCCRMLHDAVHAAGTEADPNTVKLLLVQHRRLQDSRLPVLGGAAAGLQLHRSQVVSLQRQWVMSRQMGGARMALVKWLLEAGSRQGPDASPATVRTKVFKCLGCVVEADSRIMAMPEVAQAVNDAQGDDSAAVKEAVLELLVKLISTSPELASGYFDTLVQASYDQGIMVRKRAIRALWECCSCRGFSRAGDAVVAVLNRANDREDSMRNLVTKICGEMWFTDVSSFAGLGDGEVAPSTASAARTPALRAAELAAVCLQLYEAGGRTIHVPLPPDNGLIVIVREVLGKGSSSSAAPPTTKELKEQALLQEGACEVAQALLEMILQQHQQGNEDESMDQDNASAGSFQYLLALHALTAADPSLAAPAADPQRYVRLLAPYTAGLSNVPAAPTAGRMSSAGAAGAPVDDPGRRIAEEGLCLLAVLDALLNHLNCVEQDVSQQLAASVVNTLHKQRFLQVIAVGCQLLCTLARMHAPAAAHVTQLANKVYNIAAGLLSIVQPTPGSAEYRTLQQGPRLMYMLGQLCRYGANILDAEAAQTPSSHNCTECLELCVSLWHNHKHSPMPPLQRLREAALTSLGLIVIGRPQLMLQNLQLNVSDGILGSGATSAPAHSAGSGDAGSPPRRPLSAQASGILQGLLSGENVVKVYTSVLSEPDVSMAVKGRVLTNLVELLRAEEAAVIARQKEAEAAGTAARLPSTMRPDTKAPLAKVNGENDIVAGSGSSSIIQYVWQNVLSLATGVGGRSGGSGGGSGSNAADGGLPPATPLSVAGVQEAAVTRRKALELIEVVLRGGLVAPWMAVPSLVAQLTDDLPETRATALKVLKDAACKHPDFVATNLGPGVLEAFNFQSRLWAAKHPGKPMPKGPSADVLEGLSAMYSDIVQSTQGVRQRFLTALLKPFDASCNLSASQSAAAREDPSRLAFCAYLAANLPFKKADEPLVLLHVINGYVSRLAQEVRDQLRRALLRVGLQQAMGLEDDEEEDIPAPAQQQHQEAPAVGGVSGTPATAASEQQNGSAPQQRQQQAHHTVALPLPLPLPQWLAAPLKASLGLSMLLVLKQYLMAAYALSDERVAQYELKGERARAEAKVVVARSKKLEAFSFNVVNLRAVLDGTGDLWAAQYKTFAGLLDNDAANYKEVAVLAALADNADEEEADVPAAGSRQPGETPAAAAGLVVYSMEVKTRSTRGRGAKGTASTGGRGTTGGKAGRGRGTGRGASTGRGSRKPKGRRRKFDLSDDSEEEARLDSGDEDWGSPKAPKVRKLFAE